MVCRSRCRPAAWESRNVDALVRLLVDEARFAMPPFPNWFHRRDVVIAFISGTGRPRLQNRQPLALPRRWCSPLRRGSQERP